MRLSVSPSRRGPVTAAVVTLACLATILLPKAWRGARMPPPDPAFEQTLAECIWMTIMSELDSTATDEALENRFDRALACAPPHELGRVYYFLGETDSGLVAIRKEFHGRVDEMVKSGNIDPMKLMMSENLPEPGARIQARLEASLSKLSKSVPNTGKERDEAFVRFFQGRSNFAEQCCLAAVAECPDYLPAWAKLALNAEGPLQVFALREWMVRDLENSLPCYFLAAFMAADDPDAAIRWIETGNARRRCGLPHPKLPGFSQLRFPEHNELRKLSLAGQPVSAVTFSNCRELLNPPFLAWQHPANMLSAMSQTLRDKALSDCCSMSKPDCSRLVRAEAGMSSHLMANDQGDVNLYFAGIMSLVSVEAILELDADPGVRQKEQQIKALRRDVRRFGFPPERPGAKNAFTRQLFNGEIDYVDFMCGALRKALRDSRLVEQVRSELRGM